MKFVDEWFYRELKHYQTNWLSWKATLQVAKSLSVGLKIIGTQLRRCPGSQGWAKDPLRL